LAAVPIGAIEDKRAQGDFKAFRNTFAASPHKADYVWTTIALLVAKDRGKIAANVCERGGRLYDADRSEIIWTADDYASSAASPPSNFRPPCCLHCGLASGRGTSCD
jgi:hypothetical protein